jgi:hypothetical protein
LARFIAIPPSNSDNPEADRAMEFDAGHSTVLLVVHWKLENERGPTLVA